MPLKSTITKEARLTSATTVQDLIDWLKKIPYSGAKVDVDHYPGDRPGDQDETRLSATWME